MTDAMQIVACARSWIGTRFAHQGRRKATAYDKGGVDCLGLLVGVAKECELSRDGEQLSRYDETDYGHIPDGRRLQAALAKHLRAIVPQNMQMGDVVLMQMDGNPQHLGIVGNYGAEGLSLIHAYAPSRGVVEHRLDEAWKQQVTAAYRFVWQG